MDEDIGKTLPLFGDEPITVSQPMPARPISPRLNSVDPDRHMQLAWQLSRKLKSEPLRGANRGLSPQQRDTIGHTICEHLLASLRQQVAADQATTRHS